MKHNQGHLLEGLGKKVAGQMKEEEDKLVQGGREVSGKECRLVDVEQRVQPECSGYRDATPPWQVT